jgi:ribonuclease VapC
VIINTSALAAILRDQPEPAVCARAIEAASHSRILSVNFVEAAIVIDVSRDPVASRRFDDLAIEAQLVSEPVAEAQARIAREAYRDFGRGSGAAEFRGLFCLSLGAAGEPPAVQRGDFSQTDITTRPNSRDQRLHRRTRRATTRGGGSGGASCVRG